MVFNIILDLILVRFLAHAGLALATSISAILHLIILSIALSKKVQGMYNSGLLLFTGKSLLASILMAITCWIFARYFDFRFNMNLKIFQFSQVFISGLSGIIVYYISGIIMGIAEFKNTRPIIKAIISRKMKEIDENGSAD